LTKRGSRPAQGLELWRSRLEHRRHEAQEIIGYRARPCVGAGLNYTVFFDEETTAPLTGGSLQLDPSFGLALQAGVDFDIRKGWFINIDARWIDIDTSASLDGVDLGTVEIDPYALGISGGRRF
jgi:outer membrane protein